MAEERFHIGNAAGFATDRVDAGAPVVRALIDAGAPAALFYETLAERTLAYAQRNKLRDADKGYTPDLERFLAPVLVDCVVHEIPILGNFGAANPAGAARAIHRLAQELGIEEIKVAVVEGDDVREGLRSMQVQAWEEEPLFDVGRYDIVAANAYLGARPIADALALGRSRSGLVCAESCLSAPAATSSVHSPRSPAPTSRHSSSRRWLALKKSWG